MGFAISTYRGGRMSLPVSPSQYIYSHFRHVSGVPAPEGVRGLAINKLKILDALIENLSRLKQQPQPFFGEDGESTDKRLDSLINHYESQIKTAQAAAQAIPYAAQSAAPAMAPGSLVSLSA
jgi:hypothetical protein